MRKLFILILALPVAGKGRRGSLPSFYKNRLPCLFLESGTCPHKYSGACPTTASAA
jgi:hypothetical protein